jgi:hypothetical protein
MLASLPMVATYAGDVRPPFGLRWGQGETETEGSIVSAGGRIVAKAIVHGREIWTVDGLTQPALQHVLIYFGREKSLVEVELQYQRQDWSRSSYDDFFRCACERLDARYGRGTVLATDQTTGDVTQTLTGYEWNTRSGVIQMFLFAAERNDQTFATVSLHYRVN